MQDLASVPRSPEERTPGEWVQLPVQISSSAGGMQLRWPEDFLVSDTELKPYIARDSHKYRRLLFYTYFR